MGDLIKITDGKYKLYEDLLIKRDVLYKEAESIHIAYVCEFGELLLKAFELKVGCIKKKKMIAICQVAVNRGDSIDVQDMNNKIAKSMAVYEAQLLNMVREKEFADKSKISAPYKVERAKRAYHRLAKLIHPDINPLTKENTDLMDLWERIKIAYYVNDDEELDELEVLVRRILKDNNIDVVVPHVDNIEARIDKLQAEINDIVTSEPYIYSALLSSPERIEARKEEIYKDIADYEEYGAKLSKILQQLLSEGGAILTC